MDGGPVHASRVLWVREGGGGRTARTPRKRIPEGVVLPRGFVVHRFYQRPAKDLLRADPKLCPEPRSEPAASPEPVATGAAFRPRVSL
ncbi:hypothetical protein HMPREF9440_00121 [Sutterella parvirubra YIT 11816]|uniref:Uncharacterized protein n=1 Tax=Sutterella parvirubra YIT 11816 TaxID=762967 RepID=H3KBM4_9BURK|nr:hypothetical protein HMPREF9440_00121 [Sutterella parvirubra YIT 11816]